MTHIQFGFIMPADQLDKKLRATYVQDLNRALDLVTGHFESAWIIDHLQSNGYDMLEAFTTLTYMAALHPRLKFGHTVLCQSFRNPALVAKMSATFQLLSGGRFILGMGAGWDAEEYRAYGYEFPAPHVRVEQLEEALQVIKALWTEERATYDGKYYRVHEAYCEPKPEPLPPIMVGAFRPKMLRLTAQHADGWNVSSTSITAYRRMLMDFERACKDVGRDPGEVRRSWAGGCVCALSEEAARALGGDRYSAETRVTISILSVHRSGSSNRCGLSSTWEWIPLCSTAVVFQTSLPLSCSFAKCYRPSISKILATCRMARSR